MAFTLITSTQRYACLSTDTKPTNGVKLGSLAMETDTGKEFVFNGTTWVPYSQQVSVVGSLAKSVTLQSNASATGNGTHYTPTTPETLTFEISGTSTSRTVVFELAGPKGVYIVYPALKIGDTTYTPTTSATGGSDTTPESWEVDIPANYSFRTRITAVAGGDVDISGWAVAQ